MKGREGSIKSRYKRRRKERETGGKSKRGGGLGNLTFDNLSNRLKCRNDHNAAPKRHNRHGHVRLPRPTRQLDVAKRWQDIGHGARARRADELKYGPQIARRDAEHHGRDDQARAKDEVQIHVEGLAGEVVVEHDLTAHKGLERERREHVEPKTQPRHVDHGVVGGEVVEDVAERLVAEGEETGQGHQQASEHADARGVVRHFAEAVDGRGLEGTVNEEGIVVADKGCRKAGRPL